MATFSDSKMKEAIYYSSRNVVHKFIQKEKTQKIHCKPSGKQAFCVYPASLTDNTKNPQNSLKSLSSKPKAVSSFRVKLVSCQ